ncbi:hypothetical protein BKA69DRAFT_1123693 [Paraphysoderma sedebokerense]|nr:hypothetical protein BKA69DRAFT_1123693 [Paraphysoderma sedebokerense]
MNRLESQRLGQASSSSSIADHNAAISPSSTASSSPSLSPPQKKHSFLQYILCFLYFLLLPYALVLLVYSVTELSSGGSIIPRSLHLAFEGIILSLVLSLIVAVTSLVGVFSVYGMKKRLALATSVLLIVIVCIHALLVWRLATLRQSILESEKTEEGILRTSWINWKEEYRIDLQNKLKCCGYQSPRDHPVLSNNCRPLKPSAPPSTISQPSPTSSLPQHFHSSMDVSSGQFSTALTTFSTVPTHDTIAAWSPLPPSNSNSVPHIPEPTAHPHPTTYYYHPSSSNLSPSDTEGGCKQIFVTSIQVSTDIVILVFILAIPAGSLLFALTMRWWWLRWGESLWWDGLSGSSDKGDYGRIFI